MRLSRKLGFALLAALCALPAFTQPIPRQARAAPPRTIHVFVALADNQHQGIIPVPKHLGNGDDPARNLYWGAAFGVKTFFNNSPEWKILDTMSRPKGASDAVLERAIFWNRAANVFLVADAYRGSRIRDAVTDFLWAAAGYNGGTLTMDFDSGSASASLGGFAGLVAYVGHDGLMDFQLEKFPKKANDAPRDAIILACASKSFFSDALRASGAHPLLWTSGLMAPEAYTLKAALDGWIAGETPEQIRQRAARTYSQYQKCSLRAALNLFKSGW